MQNLFSRSSASFLITLIVGATAGYGISSYLPKNEERLIRDFYATEVAVSVSPHSLRTSFDKGEKKYILVDLRSAEEYGQEHITGAISIPAYKDKNTSAYDEVDRIVAAFKALPKDKEIVTYCYSMPCMTSRKIGNILAEHGIFVKHLNIGWNEWRYFWNLWNHEHEWDSTRPEGYVTPGAEPGVWPKSNLLLTPCTEGEFGC